MNTSKSKPLAKVFWPVLLLSAALSLPMDSSAAPSPKGNGQSEKVEKQQNRRQKAQQRQQREVRPDRGRGEQRRVEAQQNRGQQRRVEAQQKRDEQQRIAQQRAESKRQAALQRQAESQRRAEQQRKAEVRQSRKSEKDYNKQFEQRQAQVRREQQRQAELNRRAELNRQAELNRRAQLQRQAEINRRAQLQRQAELNRQAELRRRNDGHWQAELNRRAEQQRYYNNRYYRYNDAGFRSRWGNRFDNRDEYRAYNRSRYNSRWDQGDTIAVDGYLTNEGYSCQALRDDTGQLFMLVGNTYGLRTGDHARVIGRVVDGGYCDWEGTAFEVTDVTALWADRRHRSTYYHQNYDGGRFGHRDHWMARRARPFENRIERNGYYDGDRNRYDDRYRDDYYDDRYDRSGNRQLIVREGRIYNARGGCPVLVTGNDEFGLTGDLRGYGNGDHVKVTGFLEGPSRCAGKTIRVGEIGG